MFSNLADRIPPAVKVGLRQSLDAVKRQAERAQLWHWTWSGLPQHPSGLPLAYLGREEARSHALELLGLPLDGAALPHPPLNESALLSEAYLPNALLLPWHVREVVELAPGHDAIFAEYDPELRRKLRHLKAECSTRQVTLASEVERIDAELLEPYAKARGHHASVPLESVLRLALHRGRLDVVERGGEVIAAHLGYALERADRRTWVSLRFGYPKSVFEDPRRLRDANAVNTYLALLYALDQGFDAYDMGSCIARPDDGLLQWKRRRAGALSAAMNDGVFHLRVPPGQEPRFFYATPLLSMEHGQLTLELGLPHGIWDEDASKRFHELGFRGLARVRLHCAREPGPLLRERLYALYARHERQPELMLVQSA